MKQEISVEIEGAAHGAFLSIPEGATGIVLFAHGSGSSRQSPRNQYVAEMIQERGLATLLIDLLSEEEEKEDQMTRAMRFDISMLSKRLVHIVDWLWSDEKTKGLKIGLFGSSTGAAAALVAAAELKNRVGAVVSRGGRTDLAGSDLPNVVCPTLFIVGGNDVGVIELNESAFHELRCKKQLQIVEGATHLFEESGTLKEVAKLTREWFYKHLR